MQQACECCPGHGSLGRVDPLRQASANQRAPPAQFAIAADQAWRVEAGREVAQMVVTNALGLGRVLAVHRHRRATRMARIVGPACTPVDRHVYQPSRVSRKRHWRACCAKTLAFTEKCDGSVYGRHTSSLPPSSSTSMVLSISSALAMMVLLTASTSSRHSSTAELQSVAWRQMLIGTMIA